MAAAQSVNFAKEGSATEQSLKWDLWSNILFSLRNIQKIMWIYYKILFPILSRNLSVRIVNRRYLVELPIKLCSSFLFAEQPWIIKKYPLTKGWNESGDQLYSDPPKYVYI